MRLSAYLFNTGDGYIQELNCAGVLRRLLEKKALSKSQNKRL
jgi:hypothetical protein